MVEFYPALTSPYHLQYLAITQHKEAGSAMLTYFIKDKGKNSAALLLQTYRLVRDVRILTDALDWGHANGSVFHVFKVMGVHDGIHEYCPGWCPCDVDLGLDEDEAAEADLLAVAAA